MKSEAHQEVNETSGPFEGYRARITEVLEKERQRLMKDAERESAKTIADARQTAQSITGQAEAKAKQEAKERTRRAAERMVAEAKGSAADAVAAATREAAEESSKTLAEAALQAEKVVKSLSEAARTAAEELARSAAEVRTKAEQEGADIRQKAVLEAERIVKDARELAVSEAAEAEAGMVAEAEQKARVMVGEAWTEAADTIDGALLVTDEVSGRLAGQVEKMSRPGPEEAGQVVREALRPAPPAAVAADDPADMFLGSVELEIAAGAGEAEMARWIAMLRKVPGLRVLSIQNGVPGSAGRFLILNDAPTPLLGILKAMPLVRDAARQDNRVVVTLADGGRQNPASP
jgi:NADH dehydrogenase/NADH:ubiquinone oxidoreductase subunit G